MKFRNDDQKRKFLNDEKYYDGLDNYCLGETMEDASEIIRFIIKDKEAQDTSSDSVGSDD